MDITTDIKPISYLKSHPAEVFEQINTTRSPVVITQNGEPIFFPWRLIYRVSSNEVYILAVLDSRQDVENVLLRRRLE